MATWLGANKTSLRKDGLEADGNHVQWCVHKMWMAFDAIRESYMDGRDEAP